MSNDTASTKLPKTRSPNFPAVSLKTALTYTETMRSKAQQHWVPLSSVVKEYWQMKSADSSYGQQIVGALRAFGLIETKGSGKKRQARVTERGAKIVSNHPDRPKLLRDAALSPRVHQTVWNEYQNDGLPPDETLRNFLVWEHDPKFNESSVNRFISQFRETMGFAKVDSTDILTDEIDDANDDEGGDQISVGDFVQWENEGGPKFESPRKVTGLTDDGEWAFVEGSKAGIPIAELTVTEPKASTPVVASANNPPVNPDFHKHTADQIPLSVKMADRSVRIIHLPRMSRAAFDFFKAQLELFEDAIVEDEVESAQQTTTAGE